MKIDINEAPKIRDLIDTLLSDIAIRQAVEQAEPTKFRVTSPDISASYTIDKSELLAVAQTRIENTARQLAQRYQVDFAKTSVNSTVVVIGNVGDNTEVIEPFVGERADA